MVTIDINSETCPSCGQSKIKGILICFYCYHRLTMGAVKLFTLLVLSELDHAVTISELVELLNKHPINNGKRIFTYDSVRMELKKLCSDSFKLTYEVKAKRKGVGAGRPQKLFKITSRKGRKFLKKYIRNWKLGTAINIKKRNYTQMCSYMPDTTTRRLSIAKKIKNGEYPLYFFLLGLK